MAASSPEPYKALKQASVRKKRDGKRPFERLEPKSASKSEAKARKQKSFPKMGKFRQSNATGIVKNKPAMRRRDSFRQKFGAKN